MLNAAVAHWHVGSCLRAMVRTVCLTVSGMQAPLVLLMLLIQMGGSSVFRLSVWAPEALLVALAQRPASVLGAVASVLLWV